jgi:hypothetical protein
MTRRLLVIVLMVTAVLVVAPDLALGASAHSDRSTRGSLPLPLAFLGIHFPSVGSIVGGVVKLFFGALLKVLGVPVHGTAAALRWLIAVPDPADHAQWPTVGRLEGDMQAVGVGLLPLTFTLAAVRYWLAGLSGQPTWSLEAVVRVTGAVGGLVAYGWAFGNVVSAVNVVTNATLAFPAVQHGMSATVGVLFAGGLAGGGVLLAIIGLVLVFLAVGLFFMKVLVLVVFGVLYVTGGALIVVSALPELHPLWRAWKLALGAAAMIPIGWCVLFALAGAFTADVTRLGGGFLTGRLVGALAALAIYAIALKWPLMVLGRAKMMLGPGALGTAGQPGSRDVAAARAGLQSAALRAGNATSSVLRGSAGAAGRGVIATGRGVAQAGARLPGIAAVAGGVAGGANALAAVAGPVRSPLQQAAGRVRERGRAGSEQTAQTLAAGSTLGGAAGAYAAGFTSRRAPHQNSDGTDGGPPGTPPRSGQRAASDSAREPRADRKANTAAKGKQKSPGEARRATGRGQPGADGRGAKQRLAGTGARARQLADSAASGAGRLAIPADRHPGRDLPGQPTPSDAADSSQSRGTPAAKRPRPEPAASTPAAKPSPRPARSARGVRSDSSAASPPAAAGPAGLPSDGGDVNETARRAFGRED